MQNLPLDTESKVLLILGVFLIVSVICFGIWFSKLLINAFKDIPEYTKEDYKREKKSNKFKSKV